MNATLNANAIATATQTKSINKALLNAESEILFNFEKKMRSIYERGGLTCIKGRQLFVNNKTEFLQVRLQHLAMLHRDDDVLSTRGSIVYYITTAKETDMKKVNTNETVFRKFFYVKSDQTESKLSVRDFRIATKSNMSFAEIQQFVKFEMPAFPDLHKSVLNMVTEKKLTSLQAAFALDYFSFLAKCLGKQPRFSITKEEATALLDHVIDPQWVQDTLNTAWTAINPNFKETKAP